MQYNKAQRSARSRTRSSSAAESAARNSAQTRLHCHLKKKLFAKNSSRQILPDQNSSENLPLKSNAARSERELQNFSFFGPRLPTRRCKFFIIESTPLSSLVVYQLSGIEGATFRWQQNHPNRAKLRLQSKQDSRAPRSPPSAPRAICGRHKAGASRRLIREALIREIMIRETWQT
jgi:hypothetical protein